MSYVPCPPSILVVYCVNFVLMFDGTAHFFDFSWGAVLNINGELRPVGHIVKVALKCFFLPRQVLGFRLSKNVFVGFKEDVFDVDLMYIKQV